MDKAQVKSILPGNRETDFLEEYRPNVHFAELHYSLTAQRRHGIHFHRPSRGKVAGQQRHRRQRQRDPAQRGRIPGPHPEQKAADQAKAEAEVIRAKADQETEQFIQQKKTEAKRAADQEAENIKAQALKQMELMREEQFNVLKAEAKSVAQRMQEELLSSIESIKRQIMTLTNKFEEIPSLSNVPFPNVPMAAEVGPDTVDYPVEKATSFDHIPWLEIEVLPPVDIGKIMDLISRLESLPAVKTTDLLPEMPNPLIRVFLNENAPLGELLRTLPQVEKVTEGGTGMISGEKERIQIVLSKGNGSRDKESKKESRTPVVS